MNRVKKMDIEQNRTFVHDLRTLILLNE